MVAVVAAVAIAVVGIAFLGVRVVSGGQSLHRLTLDSKRLSETWLYEWDRCMTRVLDTRLPEGSRVYLDPVNQYWAQGLNSLATPRLRVVAHRRQADYILAVVDPIPTTPRSERCGHVVSGRPEIKPFPVGAVIRLVITKPR